MEHQIQVRGSLIILGLMHYSLSQRGSTSLPALLAQARQAGRHLEVEPQNTHQLLESACHYTIT